MCILLVFCHQADINLAVAAAKRAFHRNSEWRLYDASKRREILNKFADLIVRDSSYLGELESYNNGMLLNLSKYVTAGTANAVRYLASLADKSHGDTIPLGKAFLRLKRTSSVDISITLLNATLVYTFNFHSSGVFDLLQSPFFNRFILHFNEYMQYFTLQRFEYLSQNINKNKSIIKA